MTVALVVAGALTLAVTVAFPTGRYLHRAAHRADSVDPRGCPPWCNREQDRERAAALIGRPPARRGAHRASRRRAPCRIRHLLQLTAERKFR